VGEADGVVSEGDVGIEPKYLLPQLRLETGHHGEDDEQRRDPDGDAGERQRRDERQERPPPRAEVAHTDHQLPAHGRRSGRSCGKRITSRIEVAPVSSMTRRSMPIPAPAVGGMPYSSART